MKYTCNGEIAGAVMTDGTMRFIGQHRYGHGGTGNRNLSRGLATVVPFPKGTYIVKAWKAVNHSFAVDSTGKLWGTGNGNAGNGVNAVCETMTEISTTSDIGDDKIVDFESQYDYYGYYQFFAIGESGKLYAWGSNRHGSLGLGDTTGRYSPTLVPLPYDEGVKIKKPTPMGSTITPLCLLILMIIYGDVDTLHNTLVAMIQFILSARTPCLQM